MSLINPGAPAHNSREEAIKMKKTLLFLLLAFAAAALLTGCASNADTLPSPTPGTGNLLDPLMPGMNATNPPSLSPTQNGAGATALPEGNATASPSANGTQTLETARQNAQAMEEAVEKLTEVDDAYVVPMGDTALVGLKFASQYQSGADERLKKMVLARVRTVDQAVNKVAVTENAALVTGIQALAETLNTASSLDDVNNKAEDMLRQLTVYTE